MLCSAQWGWALVCTTSGTLGAISSIYDELIRHNLIVSQRAFILEKSI
jgi:hypothetical protein